MKTINKSPLVLSILLATCQSVANQPNKTILLKPNNGIELTTVVGFIRSFNLCMDNVHQQLQQDNASKRRNAFNQARKNQCKSAYEQLKQSIDKKSLKSIDKLAHKRWNQREIGPGFTLENILQTPSALQSGVALSTLNNSETSRITTNQRAANSSEVTK